MADAWVAVLSSNSVVGSSNPNPNPIPNPIPNLNPTLQQKEEQDISSVITASEKPNLQVEPEKYFDDEEIEKFKKYEADYSRYLMSKYFSDKNIFGGNIFDVKMTMDGETIKASRLPPYASYADPIGFLKQISGEPTCDAAGASTNASNENNLTNKSA